MEKPIAEKRIFGERVKQARELLGYSQTELAEKLSISQPAITLIESGRFTPSEDLVNQLAFQTGFPVSFFKKESDIEFPMGSLLYRSKAKATVKEKVQIYRSIELVYELTNNLMNGIKGVPVKIPRLNEDPAEAARITRSVLGLAPDKPIVNLTNVLENAGVFIIASPFGSETVEAFSCWVGVNNPRPVIAVTDGWPNDRVRASKAHETGHLVLHGTSFSNEKSLETEAYTFSGEFLVPECAIREEMTSPVKISDLFELKKRWGVSMQFLIYRGERLGIITQRQSRYLYQQMAMNGWKKTEPVELPEEKPRLLHQLAEIKYGAPLNIKTVANNNQLPAALLEKTFDKYQGKKENIEKPETQGKVFAFPGQK